jgi:hypothetical protein
MASIAIASWKSVEGWWRLWQRAYDGPKKHRLLLEDFRKALSYGFSTLGLAATADESELEAAIRFLSLPTNRKNVISIGSHGPHAVFLPFGDDRVFVDYAFIEQRLYWLFHDISLPNQNFKGLALELYVRDQPSVLPFKPCKAHDGSSKQIDATFGIGRVLVVVECKVKARSFGFERGDPIATAQRRAFVEEALRQVDDKAVWLAHRPIGLNYDISKFEWILPLLVTPFVEFISVKDAYHWIDEQTPRVITPSEMQAGLSNGLFERVAPHYQFAQPVCKVA